MSFKSYCQATFPAASLETLLENDIDAEGAVLVAEGEETAFPDEGATQALPQQAPLDVHAVV